MNDLRPISDDLPPTIRAMKAGQQEAMAERKDRLLHAIPVSETLGDAMAFAGVTEGTFYRWKKIDPVFVRRLERSVEQQRRRKGTRKGKPIRFDPFRAFPPVPDLETFRREVFGFPSTPTQQAFCKAYDDYTNLVIFWIAPAGSGKDVTLAQATAHSAARGVPRIGWLMESEPQAKKRVNAYLDPYFTDPSLYRRAPDIPGGMIPTTDFIETWGPWKWNKDLVLPDGTRPTRTGWEAYAKWFVGRTTPMADPSLWAVGVEGAIAGSRVQMMVCSDLFTVENQKSPTQRKDQLDLINGTLDGRLDEAGRLIFLNHHVRRAGESNLAALLDQFVGDARIVAQDGDYTKYANGVAVIITPALRLSDTGEAVSYWPERFPLRDTIILRGQEWIAEELPRETLEELSAQGAHRIRGLFERRKRNPELFELIYQQNPRVSGYGDFTTEILDACDDTERTIGQYHPTERLILAVDPARSGGAAWTLWAMDSKAETFSLVDFFWADGLGFSGMRDKLIREPIQMWRPRDLVWETNFEEETPQHPEAQEVIKRFHVNFVPHRTHYNRSSGEFPVIGMLDDMRDGKIRFPAATEADRLKCRQVKDHFQNFESVGYTERRRTVGSRRLPDDLCLSSWMGWLHGRQIMKTNKRNERHRAMRNPSAVNQAFAGYRP